MALVDLEDHLVTIAHRAERGALGRAEDHGVRVGQVVDREHHRATVQDETEPATKEWYWSNSRQSLLLRSWSGLWLVVIGSSSWSPSSPNTIPRTGRLWTAAWAPASAGLPGVS